MTVREIVSDNEADADWFESLGDHFCHSFGLSIRALGDRGSRVNWAESVGEDLGDFLDIAPSASGKASGDEEIGDPIDSGPSSNIESVTT